MMWRLEGMPRYSIHESRVEARHYNPVRLAVRRLRQPLRLALEGLPHVDMIIDQDSWVCVDTTLNDMPIVAWTDFGSREGLHGPVPCQLNYFHYKAGLLVQRALDATVAQLGERFAAPPADPVPTAAGRRTHCRGGLCLVS